MVLQEDRERVQALLKDTITLLCRNGLSFRSEFSIEALIGITLDKDDVFLVSINESIKSNSEPQVAVMPHLDTNNTHEVVANAPHQIIEVDHQTAHHLQEVAHHPREIQQVDHHLQEVAHHPREMQEVEHHLRKRSRVRPDDSHSGSHSDTSSLGLSAMDDSNSRLSHEVEYEPASKLRAFVDVRNKTVINHAEVMVIKEESEEIWEEEEEEEVIGDDEDDSGEAPDFAVTDVKPKVQAVSQEVSLDANSEVWTSAQQLLSLQEQYRAARPAHAATVTSKDPTHTNHNTNSTDKSQVGCILELKLCSFS